MLPKIKAYAKFSFRHLKPEAREEAVEETVANAWQAFVRLVEQEKTDVAFPTVLARYGVRQVKDGRKVGGSLNVKDVSSKYCQDNKQVKVERLDRFDEQEGHWEQAVIEDTRNAPVPEIVAFRLDFADWLDSLTRRNKRIAEYLSLGHRTSTAARKFKVSQGRISQLRKEFAAHWKRFIGEDFGPATAA
jgi:hypothetical protein